VAIDPEYVEHNERDGDLGVAVEDSFAEERPKRGRRSRVRGCLSAWDG
jgi:hypothetical protein